MVPFDPQFCWICFPDSTPLGVTKEQSCLKNSGFVYLINCSLMALWRILYVENIGPLDYIRNVSSV